MRYDKSFCVIGSKGKFKGARWSHLPPLELPSVYLQTELTLEELTRRFESYVLPDRKEIDQIKGELKHIHNTLHILEARRKGKEVVY